MFSRFSAPGGIRDVARVGLPLVMGMASTTIMEFTDRVFLGNYSLAAIAAALPAGLANFVLLSFCMGVAEYAGVFVAQYTGAGRPRRVGAALWQGLWFCLPASLALASLTFIADPLFALAGHPAEVQVLEARYFSILCLGSGFALTSMCLSCFFSGQGRTLPVMVVNMTATVLNIPLDYALIFGRFGLPEMGIAGAALATCFAWFLSALLMGLLVFRRGNEREFSVRSSWRFDPKLFLRFLRFGLPSGVQFLMDVLGFTVFIFLIGSLGEESLAATNIVFSLNALVFLPMVGFSIAASILVGQAMGAGDPDRAAYANTSTLYLCMTYTLILDAAFVFFPRELLGLFRPQDLTPAQFEAVRESGVVLLRLVAVYCLFDCVGIIQYGALRGAGDTRFIMLTILGCSTLILVLPTWLMVRVLGWGLYPAWACVLAYIAALTVIMRVRFQRGAWRKIRVIERAAPANGVSP
ncbi:MATE family efflux transporter [Desulfovibrio aminophilus]|nr:MATE family efflux transporter [Desulfovibrio aminophilus]MCM0756067.1 MATE family efflux transporter [Desulfovibrio aminophilus]